jgi:type I site-specific restriction endonuclease
LKTISLGVGPQVKRFRCCWSSLIKTPWNGFTDFSLYHPDGSVLAVIEAKRTARNAREGEEQPRADSRRKHWHMIAGSTGPI